MPLGTIIALWVLFKKIKATSFDYYAGVAAAWALIAVAADYLFLVKAFQPAGGYYKLDVYLYYALTFALPLLVGCYKNKRKTENYGNK